MLRGGEAASRSTAIPVRATKVCSHPVPQKWRPRRSGGRAEGESAPVGPEGAVSHSRSQQHAELSSFRYTVTDVRRSGTEY